MNRQGKVRGIILAGIAATLALCAAPASAVASGTHQERLIVRLPQQRHMVDVIGGMGTDIQFLNEQGLHFPTWKGLQIAARFAHNRASQLIDSSLPCRFWGAQGDHGADYGALLDSLDHEPVSFRLMHTWTSAEQFLATHQVPEFHQAWLEGHRLATPDDRAEADDVLHQRLDRTLHAQSGDHDLARGTYMEYPGDQPPFWRDMMGVRAGNFDLVLEVVQKPGAELAIGKIQGSDTELNLGRPGPEMWLYAGDVFPTAGGDAYVLGSQLPLQALPSAERLQQLYHAVSAAEDLDAMRIAVGQWMVKGSEVDVDSDMAALLERAAARQREDPSAGDS